MTVAPTTLVLVRHGESNVTVNRTIGGRRTCSGLSDLGRRQAAQLAARLESTGEFDGAELIGPAFSGHPPVIDPGFGEHDPGPDIDGMTFDQYVERYGVPDWTGDPNQVVFPGGETLAEFHRRVAGALEAAVAARSGGTVVISCHGGVVDAAFRQLLRTAPSGGFELHTVNTSITEFRTVPASGGPSDTSFADTWRLIRYNDAAHLAGLPIETPRSTPVS
jgi:probable phosphoglycerate mutase